MNNKNRINILIQDAKNIESQIDEMALKMSGTLPLDPDFHDETGRPTESSLIEYDRLSASLEGFYQRIGILMVAQTAGMQLVDGEWREV